MNDIPGGDEGGTRPVAGVDDVTEGVHVQIKVNGITIEVTEKVEVREVLDKAKNGGAIEGSVEEYIIERVEKEGEIKIGETVKVKEHEEFLAVPTGRTDVA